jgi:hypothetical protein
MFDFIPFKDLSEGRDTIGRFQMGLSSLLKYRTRALLRHVTSSL